MTPTDCAAQGSDIAKCVAFGLPNLEVMFWGFIHDCEPWIWYFKDGCAFVALVFTLFLPYKVQKWLLLFRFMMLVGMATIAYSWGNTAFGPIGDIIFWFNYAVFRVCQVMYLAPQLLRDMREAGPMPEKTVANYLMLGKLPPARGPDL